MYNVIQFQEKEFARVRTLVTNAFGLMSTGNEFFIDLHHPGPPTKGGRGAMTPNFFVK